MSNFKKYNRKNLITGLFWFAFKLSFSFISIYMMSVYFTHFIENMIQLDLDTLKTKLKPTDFLSVAIYYFVILIPISFFYIQMFRIIRDLIINPFINKQQIDKREGGSNED